MQRWIVGLVVLFSMLGGQSALAAGYAALGPDSGGSWSAGVGGLFLSGSGPGGGHQTDVIPTVNISGLCEAWAWQVFYAFGSGANCIGGNADYILADNFDACATCPQGDGTWWFGAGATVMQLQDVFESAAGKIDNVDYGPNLGFGYAWNRWSLQLYAHYMVNDQVLAAQANVNYNFK
jgi:hypothetical protein